MQCTCDGGQEEGRGLGLLGGLHRLAARLERVQVHQVVPLHSHQETNSCTNPANVDDPANRCKICNIQHLKRESAAALADDKASWV